MTKGKVAIVGSGLIGSCWATIFSSAGYRVSLYDISKEQLERALGNVGTKLRLLEEEGLLRGTLSAEESLKLVTITESLADALKDAIYVQECTLEDVDFKRKVFAELDEIADPSTVLASSTSTIPASQFTEQLTHRSRCVVVHPVNPPLYLPLTEIIPAPWTATDVVDRAYDIMKDVKQSPVRLKKEVVGFAVNRLQFALIAEAWRLVEDDVISPEDVDKVVSDGLGPRYAFYGPLQVIHLNANGVRDYMKRYAPGMRRVLADEGPAPSFEEPEVKRSLETNPLQAVERVAAALEAWTPLEGLGKETKQREKNLAGLAQLKRKL